MDVQRALFLILFVACLPACSSIKYPEEAARFVNGEPQAVEIVRPDAERWTLPNGLQVLYVKDDELPIVSGTLFVPGGTFNETNHQLGVVSAMGAMMRIGGTKKLSPEALDRRLRELAAEMSAGFGQEYGTMSFNALSPDFEEVMMIFRDMVTDPRFDEDRLDVLKTQTLDGIRRRKDDPGTIASVTVEYLLSKKSPYGGVLESRDIRKIDRLALLRAHREFVRPDGATLVVIGDIERDEVEPIVARAFAKWVPRGSMLPSPKAPPAAAPPGFYFVEGDFNQANIYLVLPGPERFTPDRPAIRLLNNIIGDGLDSRLSKHIRADLGLAYTVYGVVIPGYERGQTTLYIQTKSESTYQALSKAVEEIHRIQNEPPPQQELQTMKQSAQASFVFRFTSPEQVYERMVVLDMTNYPEDWDETYIPKTLAVTPEEVSEAARRWWRTSEFRVVVVGSKEAIDLVKTQVANNPEFSNFPMTVLKFDEIPRGKI
ncbi:MAG: insulinase family protein [Bdellovibrionales bacterium]|nr:insulinase family protein [Bdellovibrionales bacterium]